MEDSAREGGRIEAGFPFDRARDVVGDMSAGLDTIDDERASLRQSPMAARATVAHRGVFFAVYHRQDTVKRFDPDCTEIAESAPPVLR